MGQHQNLTDADIDLASSLALYELHRFCIRLKPDVSLVDDRGIPKNELDLNTLALFLHEYTHFMHNISTVSGWTAFELVLELLAIFSHAITPDGICNPTLLTSLEQRSLSASLQAVNVHIGTTKLPLHPSPPRLLRVLSIKERFQTLNSSSIPVVDIRWEVIRRDGSINQPVTQLGSLIVEEGIAYLLESAVQRGKLNFDDLTQPTQNTPPLYPYLALQVLCIHLAPSITPLTAARLGLLALNFTHPGYALICSLNLYRVLREKGHDDVSACDLARKDVVPGLATIFRRVREYNLNALPTMFKDRGLLEEGIKQVYKWFLEGLSAREKDIWFDLAWCSNGSADIDDLSTFLRAKTPCDVIQERVGSETQIARDLLLSFGAAAGINPRILGGVRVFQAQVDFMVGHFTNAGFRATADGNGRSCPFLTLCNLTFRQNNMESCRREPWTSVKRAPTCWYGAAVAGTIGTVVLADEDIR